MDLFRLCLALGVLHPDLLLLRLSATQLAEWRAFLSLEPAGEIRADLRAAQLAHLVATACGAKVDLESFCLWHGARAAERDPEELEDVMRNIVQAFGGGEGARPEQGIPVIELKL
jgi:hypothetical protein